MSITTKGNEWSFMDPGSKTYKRHFGGEITGEI